MKGNVWNTLVRLPRVHTCGADLAEVPVHAGTVLITPREVDAGGRACLSISLSLGHRLGDLRPPVAAVTPDILLQDVHDCRAVDKEGPLWQDRAARQS